MSDEAKDSRLKFIELPRQFRGRANEVNLNCKQHLRVCEQLAVRLAREKPKTQQEFEKNEYLKDFVIKSSQLNENILNLLDYVQGVLNEIAGDSEAVATALTKDTIRLQAETVEILINQREELVKNLYEEKRKSFRAAN